MPIFFEKIGQNRRNGGFPLKTNSDLAPNHILFKRKTAENDEKVSGLKFSEVCRFFEVFNFL